MRLFDQDELLMIAELGYKDFSSFSFLSSLHTEIISDCISLLTLNPPETPKGIRRIQHWQPALRPIGVRSSEQILST
jgi:hypothetical protein